MPRRDAEAQLAGVDRVFQALAHPARRQILLVIRFRGGRMTSGEIAERFSCTWATTTHHLALLEKAGLLRLRRKGRRRIYRVDGARLGRTLREFAAHFGGRGA